MSAGSSVRIGSQFSFVFVFGHLTVVGFAEIKENCVPIPCAVQLLR